MREIAAELARRPGHEKVRGLVYRALTEVCGAKSADIELEKPIPEVHGRADAILGRAVFEFKSDLRRERADAEEQLARYLAEREKATKRRYLGVAADGADFVVFALDGGKMKELRRFAPSADDPAAFFGELESAVYLADELTPDAARLRFELGRRSLAFLRARAELAALWRGVADNPQARLKFSLWSRLLRFVYGQDIGGEELFWQHTYLSVIAKAIAHGILTDGEPGDARAFLAEQHFHESGGGGAVEADFFDWPLLADGGGDFALRLFRQTARFRLRELDADALKEIYESLIDPDTRHELGEYYTPAWLAGRICAAAIKEPLRERVVDPACGSGAFLFCAVRRLLAAAKRAGKSDKEAARLCLNNIFGVDIHPVAVQFARLSYFLALRPALSERSGAISVPVYLGDSLQWNISAVGGGLFARSNGRLDIFVPAEGDARARTLSFPIALTEKSALFDEAVGAMPKLIERGAPADSIVNWAARQECDLDAEARKILRETYLALAALIGEDRNHIWGYVARNMARPVWLAAEENKADVVVGNPPWLAYRYMNKEMQGFFRDNCQSAKLWMGGRLAASGDLSAYFYMRAAALYMRRGGRIAMLLPLAALTREPYQKFRNGVANMRGGEVRLRATDAWIFDSDLQPLFPVPSCALFARVRKSGERAFLPVQAKFFSGELPARNADEKQAQELLTLKIGPRPATAGGGESPYRKRFAKGATFIPRRFVIVKIPDIPAWRIDQNSPPVVGRESNLDKKPWRDLPPLRGQVEKQFLHPVLLGESIAPYRTLSEALGVVPWNAETGGVMDAAAANLNGWIELGGYLHQCQKLWDKHSRGTLSFRERLDYQGSLARQFPLAKIRVVYAGSGTWPAAAVIRDGSAVIESTLYWAAVSTVAEAHYLAAFLNSETARNRIAAYQARGQWGARHFSRAFFHLPFPRYDRADDCRRRLAACGRQAERIAAKVEVNPARHFSFARRQIRAALQESGVAGQIDALVARVLDARR